MILLSIAISIALALIAIMVIERKSITEDHLLYWYAALALLVSLSVGYRMHDNTTPRTFLL